MVAVAPPARIPLPLRQAKPLGRLAADTPLRVALTLPWRNAADLDALIRRLIDPKDPMHGRFLTHQQFVDRYSPTQADYDALKGWAQANGLSVDGTSPNRMLLTVSGRRDAVEAAFHVTLNRFQLATGRVVYLNDGPPKLPQSIAAHVSSVVGLTDYPQIKPFYRRKGLTPDASIPEDALVPRGLSAHAAAGTGPGGGVTPADIRSLYNINPLLTAGLNGTGQTIALFEQNGYVASNITEFASFYGLPAPTLENITIGGYDGTVTDVGTEGEVTLDIEMILAVAPDAKILVYEFDVTQNSATVNALVLQTKIVDDDLAPVISMSYGLDEQDASIGGGLTSENLLFQQMVAQGQCLWASAGDEGAYDTGSEADGLRVDDPGSQPLVVSVGGTSLKSDPIVSGVATYGSETSWNDGITGGMTEGGGGGVSQFWPLPAFQAGAVTGANSTNGISTTMRNVPDVSLNADPNTGYSVFEADSGPLSANGVTGFDIVGGTSASAPLWAAFNVLVNQQRGIYGYSSLGFADPYIYTTAEGKDYGSDFHDVNDGSTNLFYPAVTGYDDSTGWGSYNAANLLPALAPTAFGSSTITLTAKDTSGNPVSGIAVTVTTPQLPNYQLTGTTAADGTLSFTVPTGVHNYDNTGLDATLTFNISATITGEAVQVQPASVQPPAAITLTVRAPDHTYTSGTLQMIASPFDYSTVGSFAALFGLTTPLTTSALFAWAPATGAYLSYPFAPADTLRIGQGYWALLAGSAYTRLAGVPLASNTQSYRISLLPGWNMVGDPFQAAVPISGLQVDTVNPGTPVAIGSATTVQLPFYTYNGSAYQSLSAGASLQPFVGYWVHATQAAELVIPAP